MELKNTNSKKSMQLSIETNSFYDDAPVLYVVQIAESGQMEINEIKRKSSKQIIQHSIKAESWMAPNLNVIVFFYSQLGEVVFDAITLKIPISIPNTVSFFNVNFSLY